LFHVTSGKDKLQLWYGNFYAAQTFSNSPDGRRIQIGWANGVTFPGMPFNQQMTIPVQLTLHQEANGIRMHANPVADLNSLRTERHSSSSITLKPGDNPLRDLKGEQFEIGVESRPAKGGALDMDLRGTPLIYDFQKEELICKSVRAPLSLRDERVRLQIFLDRGSIEVFGNDGQVAMSIAAIPVHENGSISLSARDTALTVHSLLVCELASAWTKH
jgi:fructan beta-fructosidase